LAADESVKSLPPDRFTFRVGGLFVADNATELRVDTPFLIGAIIDSKQTLGLSSGVETFWLDGYYRFTPRHRLDFSWHDIERTGSKVIDAEIEFEGIVIPAGARVDTFLGTEFLKLAYVFSFYRSDKVELGISAGLNTNRIEVELDAQTTGSASVDIREDADATAPLPVVGIRLGYRITPRLAYNADLDVFVVSYDRYKGYSSDVKLLLEYRPSKHLGFGGGISVTNLDIEVEKDRYKMSFHNSVWGGLAYVVTYF
jgi:hypothetical protein